MLGDRITALRKKAGLSQVELAKRINVSASTIGMYEQGRREPSIEVLIALSKEFNTTVDALVNPSRQMLQDVNSLSEMPDSVQKLLGSWLQGRMLTSVSKDELAVLCFAMLMGS